MEINTLWASILVLASWAQLSKTQNLTDWGTKDFRQHRVFPIFQLIKFPNKACNVGSSARNGTCYTAEECNTLGGSNSGSCAEGYGVCCIFSLSCGEMSSQNCTYLVQSSGSSWSDNPCTYTICPCSREICRIRFDLTTFNIADPVVGTTLASGAAAPNNGAAVGDCITDTFSITSPGNRGTPIICGVNSGQHLYVDASSGCCHTAAFSLSSSSTAMRAWDIKVTQYHCGDTNGGPDGCLQYFIGLSGTVTSFNFPTTATVGESATHLSDQMYSICFRRESGHCAICYAPTIRMSASALNNQNSFGLSLSINAAAAQSAVETNCNSDYIVIRNAEQSPANSPITIGTLLSTDAGRICGRVFAAASGQASTGVYNAGNTLVDVCTQVPPFTIEVRFDQDEVTEAAAGTFDPSTNELSGADGGIIGFSLDYRMVQC